MNVTSAALTRTAAVGLAFIIAAGAWAPDPVETVVAQAPETSAQAPLVTTSRAAAPNDAEADRAVCNDTLARLADYHATEVIRSFGSRADEIRAWLADRPESRGSAPERGVSDVATDQRVVVCLVRGEFPIPGPPSVDASPPGPVDGGRFIVLPSGEPILDAAGPIDQLLKLDPKFNG